MIASHNSVWPLPWTPAIPTISPLRTSSETPSTTARPASVLDPQVLHFEGDVPGCAGSLCTVSSTARPTMSEASSSSVAVGGGAPTTLPRRMTVIRSAISCTSFSLWLMKMIDFPDAFSSRMMRNSSLVSPGVRTAVGSSRMTMLASRCRALTISTRCWMPTGRFSTRASGSMARP